MTEPDINIILHTLKQHEQILADIYVEVKRTNGRVTELEMREAEWQAIEVMKEKQATVYKMIFGTVISGSALALLMWFVSTAI